MIKILKNQFLPAIMASLLFSGLYCSDASAAGEKIAYTSDNVSCTEIRGMKIPNGNTKVTLSFRDTDVRQILRMFADKAGLNIVFQGSVSGTVTMDLVDTTLSDAFDYVMEAARLTFFVRKNTMIVMSVANAENSSFSKDNMRIIPIKYVDAASIADFLNSNIFTLGKPGLSSGKIAVTDPTDNAILLFGSEADYTMAQTIIAKLDKKPVITTYKINHVTPKEMATLICDTLFPAASGASGDSSSSDAGLAKFAGTFTGAAGQALSIGAGSLACKIPNTPTSSSTLTSFGSIPITVMYNTGLGTINLIGGSKDQIQMINEFITLHDKKQPQAILELLLLSLNEQGSQEFSNNWVFNNGTFPVNFTDGTLRLGKIFFMGPNAGRTQDFGNGTRVLYDAITWAEKTGKGRLLQKPKIVITNGAESVIDMTQDYVEKTNSTIATGTYTQAPIAEREYTIGKDQGLKMTILPFISRDGYVTLDISAEYANPYKTEMGTDELGNNYTAVTLLERRNFKLNSVRVKNGETLIIGGLIYENETHNITKIPILGDIPGLGVFFRNTTNEKKKNELVVLITPRILEDTEDMLDL